jgi:hypothetical protein
MCGNSFERLISNIHSFITQGGQSQNVTMPHNAAHGYSTQAQEVAHGSTARPQEKAIYSQHAEWQGIHEGGGHAYYALRRVYTKTR